MADFSWRPTSAPTMTNGGRTDDIWFLDAKTGWAVNSNGQILFTESGGKSWIEQARFQNDYLRCVGFANHSVGWVGTVTANSRLYRTLDGGTTWSPVTNLPAGLSAICGLWPVDDRTLYVSGTNYPNRPTGIFKTEDQGASWQFFDMRTHASLLVDIHFLDKRVGWVVGGRGGSNRKDVVPVVLHTTDGGHTWVDQLKGSADVFPKGEWGWKIHFVDKEVGFVSLENFSAGAVLRTDDGGATWRRLPVNDPQRNANLEGIGFLDRNTGWVGGWGDSTFKGGYSSRTTDGGTTWADANDIGRFLNRFRVVDAARKIMFASGDTVYRYTDEEPAITLAAASTPHSRRILLGNQDVIAEDRLVVELDVPEDATSLKLDVWDRFGEHLATIASEQRPLSGYRTFQWNVPELSTATHLLLRASTDARSESRVVALERGMRVWSGADSKRPIPTVSEEREAFHRMVNIEDFPEFRAKAHDMAKAYFENADYDASPMFAQFEYSEEAFDARMKAIYDANVPGMYAAHPYDSEVITWENGKRYRVGRASDAVVRDRLLQFAPFNLLDGAWLQTILQARPADEVQSRLFSIWSDEVGNGATQQNHSNVYRDLLQSLGLYLPDVASRDFINLDLAPGAWRSPVFQLCVGLTPQDFFPEILGMTLLLEWEATPTMQPMVRCLRGRGINPLFYSLHVAIDNISRGHGALAKEAIKIYLTEKMEEGGNQAVQESWRRIWNGYVTWATVGFNGEGLQERRLLNDQVAINLGTPEQPKCFPDYRSFYHTGMVKLIQSKADAASQVHGAAMLGGIKLNQLFDQPEELMRKMVETGLIDVRLPRKSRFLKLLDFAGPMYKVFTPEEISVVLDWAESISAVPTCIEPLPDGQDNSPWPDKMVRVIEGVAGRAKRAHDKLVLPGKDGQPEPLNELFDRPRDLMAALVHGGWVVPGDPDASIFVTRVLQNSGPMDGVLDAEDVNTIIEWIRSGAAVDHTLAPASVMQSLAGIDAAAERHRVRRPFIGQGAVH